jgi:hypothetical protein
MPFDKVMTAPLGILRVNGQVVGKCKNLTLTETIRRGDVVGIGRLAAQEKPALGWNGTLNMGFYLIDFSISPIPGAINRNMNSIKQWQDTLILAENGIQIDVMRKVVASISATGVVTSTLVVFASIIGAFCNRETMDITENQMSGRNQDFDYITPILYPI